MLLLLLFATLLCTAYRRILESNNNSTGTLTKGEITKELPWRLHGDFPSPEERILFYMGDWYIPPHCNTSKTVVTFSSTNMDGAVWIRDETTEIASSSGRNTNLKEMLVTDDLEFDTVISLSSHDTIEKCIKSPTVPLGMRECYCPELAQLLRLYEQTASLAANNISTALPPLLVQVGDATPSRVHRYAEHWQTTFFRDSNAADMYPTFPFIKKFRRVMDDKFWRDRFFASCLVSPRRRRRPIIWKLEAKRHYDNFAEILELDTPWESKTNTIVFRGGLRGWNGRGNLSEELCTKLQRCRLVSEQLNNSLVDARITGPPRLVADYPQWCGPKVKRQALMQHKGIIFLEGNDVSSGLKWGLLSKSVILMPAPTKSSWAMEEWLQPYVHVSFADSY